MDSCHFMGNSDMYGLGIRIGFYLQWYGGIMATMIAKSEIIGIRISNALFIAATFLALLIQVANNGLRLVEVYIILLLTFGSYLYFVPLYVWRLITGCSTRWDPSRYPRVRAGKFFSGLNFLLLLSVTIFQLWFWCSGVRGPRPDNCTEYGFLFGRVSLHDKAFVALNIVLYLLLLLVCVGVLGITIRKQLGFSEPTKRSRNSKIRKIALQELQCLIRLAVAGTITAATELTIDWNKIDGVNDVSAAGQTIPMVIGIGQVVQIIYVAFFKFDPDRRSSIWSVSTPNTASTEEFDSDSG